jgi:hypothetical protein
VAAKP